MMESASLWKNFGAMQKGDKRNVPEEHKPFIRIKSQSGVEHVHYSLTYEGFPEEFQSRAAEELNETPEARKRGLHKLREYMQSHDIPPFKDELILLVILRACKYNMKNAESKLKKFANERREIIARLRALGMEKIGYVLDDTPCGLLPYRDKHGRVVFYSRPYGLQLERYTIKDVALVITAAMLFAMSFPITSVAGFAYFGECKTPSQHLIYCILKEVREYMFVILSFAIRLSRLEILNENFLYRCFYNVVRPFLSKKILSRISFHGSDFEQFFEMYDPKFLPEEFGGTAGPLSNQAHKQKFMDFIRDLIQNEPPQKVT